MCAFLLLRSFSSPLLIGESFQPVVEWPIKRTVELYFWASWPLVCHYIFILCRPETFGHVSYGCHISECKALVKLKTILLSLTYSFQTLALCRRAAIFVDSNLFSTVYVEVRDFSYRFVHFLWFLHYCNISIIRLSGHFCLGYTCREDVVPFFKSLSKWK